MEDKTARIIHQVRELMFRLGIKSLTMDDIAQQLGISKKTLYQVVANKADLVEKVVELSIVEAKKGLNCVRQENDNAMEELLGIYRQNCKIAGTINPVLLFELKKYFPESWKKMEQFRTSFIESIIKENMVQGIASGLYRKDINIDIISRLFATRSVEIFSSNIFPATEYAVSDILKVMFLYHMRGISTTEGHRYLEEHLTFEV